MFSGWGDLPCGPDHLPAIALAGLYRGQGFTEGVQGGRVAGTPQRRSGGSLARGGCLDAPGATLPLMCNLQSAMRR